jgi:hypothetical protein
MSIDANTVVNSIGNGMKIGASVLGAVNIIGLPVSYVANRFIYHSKGMRFLLCIVTAILSIPILLGMLAYQGITWGTGIKQVHYFNYLPFITKSGDVKRVDSGEIGWIESVLTPLWDTVYDILFGGVIDHLDLPEDELAFQQSCDTILLPMEQKGDPRVAIQEKAVELAQEAARAQTKEDALALEQDQQSLLVRGSTIVR